ncbi:MAG: riboflavin synthase [Planctomycetota bacterium]
MIQHVGIVRTVRSGSGGAQLSIELGPLAQKSRLGDSIAIDGCCLTITGLDMELAHFDAVPETLRRTTLGELQTGARVNLETALLPSTPLGGHFVQGHVDGTATITKIIECGQWVECHLKLNDIDLATQIVEKGSIAVDGISLTVAGCDIQQGAFWVALIPETLSRTTFSSKRPGTRVNIETDILGKYILAALQRHLATSPGGARKTITEEFLREQGY